MHGTGLKVNESFWEKIHLIFLSLLPCHVVLRAYAAVFSSRISLLSSRWGLIKNLIDLLTIFTPNFIRSLKSNQGLPSLYFHSSFNVIAPREHKSY
jgi:hypothetical protein